MSLIEAEKDAKDPVCGMTVDPATTEHRFDHDGRTYFFCCAGCRAKFAAEPARYLRSRARCARARSGGNDLHLPDAPRGAADGPGACPICGMALEPLSPSAETGPNAELIDMKRRLWFALALAIPVVVLDMGGHLFGANWLAPQLSNWLQLVLATPVALGAGWPFFVRAAASIRNAQLQHVHPHRHRGRRRVAGERRRDRRAGGFSARFP